MALMFPRLARNFARNGYYPTDETTLELTLQALAPSSTGKMRIFDPCAGEGVALAETAHVLGRDRVETYAVEYDQERANHCKTLLDRVLHSDLMDTMISRQAFGLLWLNPPYGDLVADHAGASQYQGKGRRRLEKMFYQRTLPLLQYGGVLVLIVPHYVLDDELCSWLCNHFTELRIYNAADPTFKQVVIFGIRIRRQDLARPQEVKYVRARLQAIGAGTLSAEALPISWTWEPYRVLPASTDLEHFYRISLEPEQLSEEVKRLRGMWPDFTLHFGQSGAQPRPPVRKLSRWHLALALAAGAISGVVTSKTGRVLALKGDTYKDKVRKTEFTEDQDGNVSEVRILTDRFVPIIRAWDMTPDSTNLGKVITISSSADPQPEPDEPVAAPAPNNQPKVIFDPGRVLLTQSVQHLMEHGYLDPTLYLRRHFSGDWGELPDEDRNSNQRALTTRERLFSSYNVDVGDETRLWIITEADRSATTVLLPSDY
ncbi:class I SAM-dependent methyltransferase [Pseudomonas marginalis]|uniref:Class I SAM-dependent methyltransferase n=1 Tax=Pseudomonas marginalis TaxID=298 RepID=A0A9X9FUA2_PSEMA|nr:DUF6094 domain-containing protein [Pseudomonas marginalis]TWR48083.1 class I SAM-dependent methyltransferase [Pseudomonas marginalis]SEB32947.1 hypothetical protein SAMN04490193_0208 [Pseudomonas marginalis]